jgi:hypothetical protein
MLGTPVIMLKGGAAFVLATGELDAAPFAAEADVLGVEGWLGAATLPVFIPPGVALVVPMPSSPAASSAPQPASSANRTAPVA